MRRPFIGALTAFALALSPAAFIAGEASASATASYTITTFDTNTESNLANVNVELYSNTTGTKVGLSGTTDNDGHKTFSGLEAGRYTVKATLAGYYTEYSTFVEVADGGEASNYIDLDAIPKVTGKLRGAATYNGAPTSAYYVRIYPGDITQSQVDYTNPTYAYGQSSGQWGIKLAPGTYRVKVYSYNTGDDIWVGSEPNNADTATVFTVASNGELTVPTVAFSTEQEADATRLKGKVTSAAGLGLGNVRVSVIAADATTTESSIATLYTEPSGTYAFGRVWTYTPGVGSQYIPLPAGSYRILFNDNSGEFTNAFYAGNTVVAAPADGSIPSAATTVTVNADGIVTAATSALTKAVQPALTTGVSGRLANDVGTGIRGSVFLSNNETGGSWSVDTFTDGTWRISGEVLAPGTYAARFYGDNVVTGKGSVTVPVKGAGNAGTIKLVRKGSIKGKITLAGHAELPLLSRGVSLTDLDGDSVCYDDFELANDGSFTFTGVAPGAYTVWFSGERSSIYDENLDYIGVYFGGALNVESARTVTVKPGATTTNVNAALTRTLTPTVAPSIAGTAKAGQTLTAKAGVWTKKAGTTFSYTWKIGAKVVGTAGAYKVATADAGKVVRLTVTAKNPNWDTGSASKTVTVAKAPPVKKAKKKSKKKSKKK